MIEETYEFEEKGNWQVTPIEAGVKRKKHIFLDGSCASVSPREFYVYVGYLELEGWELKDSGVLMEKKEDKLSTSEINDVMTGKELEVGKEMVDEDTLVCFDGVRPAKVKWGNPKHKYISLAKTSKIRKNGHYLVDKIDDEYDRPIVVKNVFRRKPDWVDEIAFVKFGRHSPPFQLVYNDIDLKEEMENLLVYCRNSYAWGYPLPFYGVHVLASENRHKQVQGHNLFLKKKVNAEDKRMAWIRAFRGD